MDKYLYLDVIPKIRVYEKKLIDKVTFDRMLSFSDSNDLFRFLSETSYGDSITGDINSSNYELMLSNQLNELFINIDTVCKDKKILDIFIKKYFYNNLKLILKSKFTGIDCSNLLFNINDVDNNKIYEAINTDNYALLDKKLSFIVNNIVNSFNENGDYSQLDFVLDNAMFDDLKNMAYEIGDSFLINYIDRFIDVFNIKTLFRFRKLELDKGLLDNVIKISGTVSVGKIKSMFLEPKDNLLIKFSNMEVYKYIKNGLEKFIDSNDMSILELGLDNYLIEYLKYGKIVTSGLLPIIGYIIGKENELRNVRLIIISKINNIPPEFIKGRLTVNYV